jgi:hypothetical protein
VFPDTRCALLLLLLLLRLLLRIWASSGKELGNSHCWWGEVLDDTDGDGTP